MAPLLQRGFLCFGEAKIAIQLFSFTAANALKQRKKKFQKYLDSCYANKNLDSSYKSKKDKVIQKEKERINKEYLNKVVKKIEPLILGEL